MSVPRLATAGIVAVIVAGIAFGGWYLLLRDDAPPPVDLAAAVASISTPAPTSEPSASPTVAPAVATVGPATATAAPEVAAGVEGTWTVSSAQQSFAGYRVIEELSSIGTNTAVGRTSDLTGALEFDGSTITAVDIEVNVASLSSDDNRRDRQLRERGLQTNNFPTATFSLTTPIDVDPMPSEGEPFAATVTGDLTLHGVTRPVSIELNGQLVDGLVVVVGSTELQFADFGIVAPTGLIVLSVEDHGILEFQLFFQRAS